MKVYLSSIALAGALALAPEMKAADGQTAAAGNLGTSAPTAQSTVIGVQTALNAIKVQSPAIDALKESLKDGKLTPDEQRAIRDTLAVAQNNPLYKDAVQNVLNAVDEYKRTQLPENLAGATEGVRKAIETVLGIIPDNPDNAYTRMILKSDLKLLADGLSQDDMLAIQQHADATGIASFPTSITAALSGSKSTDPESKQVMNKKPKEEFDPNNLKKNIRYDYPVGEGFQQHPNFTLQAQGTVSPTANGGLQAKVKDSLDINAGKTAPLTVPDKADKLWIDYESEVEIDRKSKGSITPIYVVFMYGDGRAESRAITPKKTVDIPKGTEKIQLEFCVARGKPTGSVKVEKVEVCFK